MKKVIYVIIIAFLFSNSAFSQMDDGNYKFANKEITLSFTISEFGWKMTDINLTNNTTKKTINGTGEMMRFNMMTWYQFKAKDCDFEFDTPTNKMTLSQNCGSGKSKKYQLVKTP
jgi:hypothetical protein